ILRALLTAHFSASLLCSRSLERGWRLGLWGVGTAVHNARHSGLGFTLPCLALASRATTTRRKTPRIAKLRRRRHTGQDNRSECRLPETKGGICVSIVCTTDISLTQQGYLETHYCGQH